MKAMTRNQKILAGVAITAIVVVGLIIAANPSLFQQNGLADFPDFYTKNEDYYLTRIGAVPNIDRDSYRLKITGLVDNPTDFSLDELEALNLTELPLTIECIGNGPDGKLVGTAMWKGFNVFDLLESLGMSENATGIKCTAADGYYASYTLGQLENNGVLGALYMNGVEIPPVQGFPLRLLNPGYYGVKQPAWVTGIEVIDRPLEDYWQDRGWDTSQPIAIDSKIFFPDTTITISPGDDLRVGGCAYGGTRVKLVEYTTDGGAAWSNATIVKQIDADNVWVFWEAHLNFSTKGQYIMGIRATDIYGNQQPRTDTTPLNGTNSWPTLVIDVT